ncbi:MAG TPA: DUF4397 domain-containing protein [Gemmatimonadaceae bacterium]|jgi:hypothetical protein|nr:DUF4397 domain-containing protein [Gemmatimonadaceae bacterium]
MRALRIWLAFACTTALAACSGDASKVFLPDVGNPAYVRFVNAIPDSGSQDWRFVDQVDGSPTTLNLSFRGVFPGASYQPAASGTRHLKIFQSALDQTFADPTLASPAIVSTVFVDSTFTLTAGTHYTIVAVGSLRSKTAKFLILTDNYADPGSNIALRAVNLNVAPSLDVYASATGGSSALPTSPLVSGLAALTASAWNSAAPGPLALRANAAGSKTLPAMVDVTAPAGVAADRTLNLTAVGGSTIAGSAFTAFIFPAAVTGSLAANVIAATCPTRCTTAGIVFAVDKYPPSGF